MRPKLKPIRDQVVVLVGASSGIGRQTAIDFAARGASVVIAARDREALLSVAEEIRDRGGRVAAVAADTSIPEHMTGVAGYAVSTFGRIDTWVHLAAVALYATFEQTTPEEWRRIIDVDLNGQAYGAMAALPHLRKAGGGALIHISSIEARRSLPYQSAYSAAKHGISGMLDALRLELQHERVPISVTEIMPASVNTSLFEKARTRMGVKPAGLAPLYTPADVSSAILHASEHPVREFVVGGAGKLMQWTQEISPGLADKLLLKVAFQGQKTTEQKSGSAPDNLYEPLRGRRSVNGGQRDHRAVYNWVEMHPIASKLVLIGALTAAVTLMLREGAEPPK